MCFQPHALILLLKYAPLEFLVNFVNLCADNMFFICRICCESKLFCCTDMVSEFVLTLLLLAKLRPCHFRLFLGYLHVIVPTMLQQA